MEVLNFGRKYVLCRTERRSNLHLSLKSHQQRRQPGNTSKLQVSSHQAGTLELYTYSPHSDEESHLSNNIISVTTLKMIPQKNEATSFDQDAQVLLNIQVRNQFMALLFDMNA